MNKWALIIPASTITVVLLLLGILLWTQQDSFVRPPEAASATATGASSASSAKKPSKRKSGTNPPAGRLKMNKPYVVIDRYANKLYLRTEDSVILAADCSTGTGAELTDTATGRHWKFDTPTGVFIADSKLEGPWWRKPDWAFIEEGEEVPLTEEERMDPNVMGAYAIGFGNGYFVHGTLYERLLGVSVTHGCVRLGEDNLKNLYGRVNYGTYIYIY
ncbi:MAG: L,D-transpeptidase [candidate division Zixibacteria bacterium]|nr:L,D-transpeptidase [candidate division Zixibacteria bacterium]